MLPNDVHILFSVVNTKLRDSYPSLEALCDDLDVPQAELCEKLQKAGFIYSPAQNQFVRG